MHYKALALTVAKRQHKEMAFSAETGVCSGS